VIGRTTRELVQVAQANGAQVLPTSSMRDRRPSCRWPVIGGDHPGARPGSAGHRRPGSADRLDGELAAPAAGDRWSAVPPGSSSRWCWPPAPGISRPARWGTGGPSCRWPVIGGAARELVQVVLATGARDQLTGSMGNRRPQLQGPPGSSSRWHWPPAHSHCNGDDSTALADRISGGFWPLAQKANTPHSGALLWSEVL